MSQQTTPVRSPCISVCVLNDDDICTGCYRSAAEITRWMSCSDAERQTILSLCRERFEQLQTIRLK